MDTKINSAIWLDSDKAYLVHINKDGSHEMKKILSAIEHHVRYDGESDSASRFGSQYLNSENSQDERRKHQEHNYYKGIISELNKTDKILICGPAQAKKGLEKEIKKNKSMASKIADVLTADSMTENQIIAYVTNYFSKAS